MTAPQDEAIAALSDPQFYEPPVASVERVDTHGAMVFLAGDKAYKIKKAVRFSYMDFSTLAKRETACRRELALNQPAAPQIYLDVVALTRGPTGLELAGTGEVVEWVVRMNRFDQSALASRQCLAGKLTPALLDAVADRLGHSHEAATCHREVDWAARFGAIVDGAAASFSDYAPGRLKGRAADVVSGLIDATAKSRRCLGRRATSGRVRHCHGDLHLDNIVILDGEPVFYDALEFDENLARIDVLYDLAFLLMDLVRLGERGAANRVLNRYLQSVPAGELLGLGLLPLYIGLRAAIRAMVDLQRSARQPGVAEAYLDAAHAALHPARPRLVAVGGLSGTGKSTLAAMLAPDLGGVAGAVHLRSDVERKRLFGVAPKVRLGPEAYTSAVSERVYRRLFRKAVLALGAGQPVIVDAVFARRHERRDIEAAARRAGVRFTGLWLAARSEVMIERVEARRGDASDATGAVVRQQLELVEEPSQWQHVDASGAAMLTLRRARQLVDRA